MKSFNSLSPTMKLVVIVIILLIVLYLYRKYATDIKNLFQPKEITPSNVILPDGSVIYVATTSDLPQSIKLNLEADASDLKKDIYGLNTGGYRDSALYTKVSGLSDVEIDYLADYYKRYLTNGTSLYEDMSGEQLSWFQDNAGFKNLLIKLEKTGNR